jgi:hypothetical protein
VQKTAGKAVYHSSGRPTFKVALFIQANTILAGVFGCVLEVLQRTHAYVLKDEDITAIRVSVSVLAVTQYLVLRYHIKDKFSTSYSLLLGTILRQ